MRSYFILIYIESPKGVTLLKFKEEAEDNQETPQPAASEGEEPATNKLLECPESKPQSIGLDIYTFNLVLVQDRIYV